VLALGSNLGDRLRHLRIPLREQIGVARMVGFSSVWETAAVGGPAMQPDYLNAVVVLDADYPPMVWLALAHDWELVAGRERRERWGPRTLDVDVVSVEEDGVPLTLRLPRLTLPHPRAYERAFVLAPWAELQPDAELPGHGVVRELLGSLELSGVWRRDDVELARVAG
jgi:2-amino-4-hydroxy-6-hydroxymethyldihydropteridine diphosphokinase